MRPGLIPRFLSLQSGDTSMIYDILWVWSEGRGSLVPRSCGRRESVLMRLKDVHTYLKNANSLKSFQLKSVKRYPSREKARMALGPTHTEPSIRGVKCTPKNGKRGSGTWQGKSKVPWTLEFCCQHAQISVCFQLQWHHNQPICCYTDSPSAIYIEMKT